MSTNITRKLTLSEIWDLSSRLRAGWYFGTDRFETEGEYIRIVIDDASYQ